jgi:hypothetical protein
MEKISLYFQRNCLAMRRAYNIYKRAEGPIYTSLGQPPWEAVMPINPGLKARSISFIDLAFSPSVSAYYNPSLQAFCGF